jgi:hypothetical protein
MNTITSEIKNLSITNQETISKIPMGGSFDITLHGKSICNDLDKDEELNYFVSGETITLEHPTSIRFILDIYQGLEDGTCKIVPIEDP